MTETKGQYTRGEWEEIKTGFYNELEPEIRDIVKVLRDNGVNTTCSCGHEMYVEADIIPDGMLQTIHRTLFNYLTENKMDVNYTITVTLEQNIVGLSRCFAYIKIGDAKTQEKACVYCRGSK